MIEKYQLSPGDIELIAACLDAAIEGPFFPEWEFHTLFGVSRNSLKEVRAGWPKNESEQTAQGAVRNTINNLISYPHKQDEQLQSMGVDARRLRELFDKLR